MHFIPPADQYEYYLCAFQAAVSARVWIPTSGAIPLLWWRTLPPAITQPPAAVRRQVPAPRQDPEETSLPVTMMIL